MYKGHTEGVGHGSCRGRDVHMPVDRVAGLWQSGHSCICPVERVKRLIQVSHLSIGDNRRNLE